MLMCINDSALTPAEGHLVDPLSVAPSIASDLVNAVVIPQFVSLVKDTSVDELLLDFDEITFDEIDRLVDRLEQRSTTLILAQLDVTTESQTMTPSGRGQFSNAIAMAHRRLDKAGVARMARVVSTPNGLADGAFCTTISISSLVTGSGGSECTTTLVDGAN